MQSTGLLVTKWPIVLGCDASGIVIKAGAATSSTFKVGDRVCGCTRLGVPGFSTFQEYFLMDANLALPIPKDLSFQQGATLGVGTYTACLGLLGGLKLEIPDTSSPPPEKEDWVVIRTYSCSPDLLIHLWSCGTYPALYVPVTLVEGFSTLI